ncbi:MAG: hypothetical protein HQL36_01900 [Alphaproteobacteria bacterium]|nr:hypothetical protein [Alphaproteobacteria bacterium]
METKEFLKRVKAYARETGQPYSFDPKHGKGSHGRVTLGARFTTVKRGEFGPGLLNKMLDDLGIDKKEF